MFPKFHTLSVHAQHILEGCALGLLAAWQGVEAGLAMLSAEDWRLLLGPNGLAVGAVVALIVVWRSNTSKEKREEESRERRHQEQLASADARHKELVSQMKENSELNKKLTEDNKELLAESIKANLKGVGAINSMDNNIKLLTMELKERPCQKIKSPQDDAS